MKLSRNGKRVLIETQKGGSGLVVSYNAFEVMGCLGEYNLRALDLDTPAPFLNGVTRRQAIQAGCYGRSVKKAVLVAG